MLSDHQLVHEMTIIIQKIVEEDNSIWKARHWRNGVCQPFLFAWPTETSTLRSLCIQTKQKEWHHSILFHDNDIFYWIRVRNGGKWKWSRSVEYVLEIFCAHFISLGLSSASTIRANNAIPVSSENLSLYSKSQVDNFNFHSCIHCYLIR